MGDMDHVIANALLEIVDDYPRWGDIINDANIYNISHLSLGYKVKAIPYDYTATIECLPEPYKPQYNGGIIVNSEFNEGIKGWSTFGNAKIEHKELFGNKYIVAHSRNASHDSLSQEVYLRKDRLYSFSAWLQVSHGEAPVTAVFKTASGFIPAGAIVAEVNCWSMLKGGLTVNVSGLAQLYFESKNTSVEIWVDNISLQPFTEEEWKSYQDQSIEKARKSKVSVQAIDKKGNPIPNAIVSFEQNSQDFPLGCAIDKNILTNQAYQNWFLSRFKYATFGNEMKWASTEYTQWKEDYSVPDAMLRFTSQHGVSVRGHNIFWEDPNYQPQWVKSLSPADLYKAVDRRIYSLVRRYRGKVIAWDVVNENMHFNFYESRLGSNFSSDVYKKTHIIDRQTPLFLNEFNTIEDSRDTTSLPAKYLQRLRDIQKYSGAYNLGIGLESHFHTPNLPFMRAGIDYLGSTNLPIWLTEVDVDGDQPTYLEQVLREGYSHPKVRGIIIWGGWSPNGCYRMCLTDSNFKNLDVGDVVDKLLREWKSSTIVKTDANGFFESSLFHGDYRVKISHPTLINSSLVQSFKVTPTEDDHLRDKTLVLDIE
ncbi:hypothetical protein ACFE04_028958 [Oxalis oulophora]